MVDFDIVGAVAIGWGLASIFIPLAENNRRYDKKAAIFVGISLLFLGLLSCYILE